MTSITQADKCMDRDAFSAIEHKLNMAMYEMTPAQREVILSTVIARVNGCDGEAVQVFALYPADLQRAIKGELGYEPSEDIIKMVRESSAWSGMAKRLKSLGYNGVCDLVRPLKRIKY